MAPRVQRGVWCALGAAAAGARHAFVAPLRAVARDALRHAQAAPDVPAGGAPAEVDGEPPGAVERAIARILERFVDEAVGSAEHAPARALPRNKRAAADIESVARIAVDTASSWLSRRRVAAYRRSVRCPAVLFVPVRTFGVGAAPLARARAHVRRGCRPSRACPCARSAWVPPLSRVMIAHVRRGCRPSRAS